MTTPDESRPKCSICGRPIPENARKGRKFCSTKCELEKSKIRVASYNPIPAIWAAGLSKTRIGEIHELVVCADLLKRGLAVFRAASPAETCDMLILTGTSTVRVEVTTGNITGKAGYVYSAKKATKHRYDLLAVVLRSGTIIYNPALAEIFPGIPDEK